MPPKKKYQTIKRCQSGLLSIAAPLVHDFVAEPELNRLRRARLRAGRPEAVVDTVVAERALIGPSRVVVEGHHTEGAGADTVPAAVADILVDVDGSELGPVDRAGRARLETAGLRAVLAHVGHHVPLLDLPFVVGLLEEPDEAVALVREVGMVLVGPRPLRLRGRELVPLLAGDLAGATPDAQGNVCEHRERACHGYASFLTLQRRAFDS